MKATKNKQPWPTKEAMIQVYEKKMWGGQAHDYYSGEGSHHPNIVEPYVHTVKKILSSLDKPISVCDLGCGDFNIGQQLLPFVHDYIAVDIVPSLIARNQKKYTNVTFKCLDIAKDNLPKANCAIIRQVLQHLSNAEIAAVVRKLQQYPYVLLTEHLPSGDFVPNLDIISGQGIRIKKKSGVDLLAAPFNYKPKEVTVLQTIELAKGKGKIVTVKYQN